MEMIHDEEDEEADGKTEDDGEEEEELVQGGGAGGVRRLRLLVTKGSSCGCQIKPAHLNELEHLEVVPDGLLLRVLHGEPGGPHLEGPQVPGLAPRRPPVVHRRLEAPAVKRRQQHRRLVRSNLESNR